MRTESNSNKGVITAIIVAALGYFVDIYDLILFSMVRRASLGTLGYDDAQITSHGELLLNMQMGGMLIGGLLWGILGDKKGRLSVLFGSILMYSLANIANGMVNSIEMYASFRFIAGIGLAGELGAGITLVSEIMAKHKRGYGTTIVAAFGLLGAVAAGLIVQYDWGITWNDTTIANWRIAYFIGGIMGLLLLVMRIGVYESGMFKQAQASEAKKGDLKMLFLNKKRLIKYLHCILIGLPLWFTIGILVTQSVEFARANGLPEGSIKDSVAIMIAYIGLVVGDIASGVLSQALKSRRKSVLIFLILCIIFTYYYLNIGNVSANFFYTMSFLLGFGVGYWAVFVTIASEHFGTNLRATVTTTVPNFVRGALIPITLLFQIFKNQVFSGPQANLYSAMIVGGLCLLIALSSLYFLEETFDKELDYFEQ